MSSHIGISGLKAAITNLNTVSHNVANASTVGFKNSRAEFEEVIGDRKRHGIGAATQTISQMFGQGAVLQTEQDGATGHLDLAIMGEGFFGVRNVTTGQGTVTTPVAHEYTRAGSFHLDTDGYMVNNLGQRLQGPGGDVRLSPGAQITQYDNTTGRIHWEDADGEVQDPVQLGLVSFVNPKGLSPVGETNWEQTKSSGNPSRMDPPSTGGLGKVWGGMLEASNVDLTGELVGMILAQRDYTANAKTITTDDRMKDTVINMAR